MATQNIGRVVPLWKGTYSALTEYELNDVVKHNSSTYWHKSAEKTVGIAPTDETVWALMNDASVIPAAVAATEAAQAAAETAEANAETARAAAEESKTNAEAAKDTAVSAKTDALNAKTAAEAAQEAAELAQNAAETAETNAEEAAALATSVVNLTDMDDANKVYAMAWSVESGFPVLTLTERT